MEVAPCIELIPGANYYVVPEKATPIPRDFVDLNTYYYRLVEGEMKLKGIALGPGWELRNFDAKKLSCYKQKGRDNEMASKKREAPAKEELIALYIKHEGKIDRIRKELGISWLDAKKWLVEAGIIDSSGKPASTSNYNFEWCGPRKKQTPTPEPVQAANQEPDEGEVEPATDSIPYSVERIENIGRDIPPVNMPIGCSLPLEDNTEAEQEEMAKCDTIQDEGAGEYVSLDIEWPPQDKVEKAIIEASVNATFAVRRVLNDPVALALMKQALESGVV